MSAQIPTTGQLRERWERIAARFDEHTTPQTIALAEWILDRLHLGPDVRFLDVAAGSGGLGIPAARRGAQVVAVDIAPTMIERLVARARREGLANVEAHVMDGTALDFGDDTFDVVASLNGVSLFPDLPGGLRELVRVLKPGGRALIVAFGPTRKAEFLRYFHGALQAVVPRVTPSLTDWPHYRFQIVDPVLLRRRLDDAGLTYVTVETVPWHMPFESGAHLWDVVTSTDPAIALLAAEFACDHIADIKQVLDGMLRERSGGSPGATLTAEMNVGLGVK